MQKLQHQQEAGKCKFYAAHQSMTSGQAAPARQKYRCMNNYFSINICLR